MESECCRGRNIGGGAKWAGVGILLPFLTAMCLEHALLTQYNEYRNISSDSCLEGGTIYVKHLICLGFGRLYVLNKWKLC